MVAVHVALVLRSATGSHQASAFKGITLFGDDYVSENGRVDPGTRIHPADLASSVHARVRLHVEAVIFLHKPERVL